MKIKIALENFGVCEVALSLPFTFESHVDPFYPLNFVLVPLAFCN